MHTVWLNVLGRVEVTGIGKAPILVPGHHAGAFLALLGERHQYDQQDLVDVLWHGESVLDSDSERAKGTSNKFHRTMTKARASLGPAGSRLTSKNYEVNLQLGPDTDTGLDLRTDAAKLYALARSNDPKDLHRALAIVKGELGKGFPQWVVESPPFVEANARVEATVTSILSKLFPAAANLATRAKEVLAYGGTAALHDWGINTTGALYDHEVLFTRLRQIQVADDLDDSATDDDRALAETTNSWVLGRELLRIKAIRSASQWDDLLPPSFHGRRLQVALDITDLSRALAIAESVAGTADFIEIGDPLLRHYGLTAVEAIHRRVPDTPVVVEMVCSDWAGDHVQMAASAGADVVSLMGCRTDAALYHASQVASRLRVPLFIDIPSDMMTAGWVKVVEGTGVHGVSAIANLDSDPTTATSVQRLRLLRQWTHLPIAVSGGFTLDDFPGLNCEPWDIVVIGRAIFSSDDPGSSAQRIARRINSKGCDL